MRSNGIKVMEWWFRQTAKKIMSELHPDVAFKMSNRWFQGFKARYNIHCDDLPILLRKVQRNSVL